MTSRGQAQPTSHRRFVVCIGEKHEGTIALRILVMMLLVALILVILSLGQPQWFDNNDQAVSSMVTILLAITMPWMLVMIFQEQQQQQEEDSNGNDNGNDNDQKRKQQQSTKQQTVAVVSVYPLGIQLTVEQQQSHQQCQKTTLQRCCFVPRDQIVDCIVTEIISFTRVTSAVVFRVIGGSTAENAQMRQHDKNVQLLPAFPGADTMTYQECLFLQHEISKALLLGADDKKKQ